MITTLTLGFMGLDSSQILKILGFAAIPIALGIIAGIIKMNRKTKLEKSIRSAVISELKNNEPINSKEKSVKKNDELLAQIEKLGKLKDNGLITDAEFQEQKKKILDNL